MDRSLKLSEKLFCLAINPNKGGLLMSASSVLSMTLAGSVVVELMKQDLIAIENKVIRLKNPTMQSDEIHEFFLRHIREHRKDRKLRSWISYFNMRGRKVQKLFIRNLVRKNVLRTEERRILFIPYEKVFLMDRDLVETIRRDVENVMLSQSGSSEEMVVLAMMTEKTNLLSRIFPDRARRKEASRNLKNMPETEVSKAVKDAIQMMHAAVYASIS